MKVAIIGSTGMAGHIMTRYLRDQGYQVTTLARSHADMTLDIENIALADQVISSLTDYDFVVNCSGLLVQDSIQRPDRAALVNSWFPHFLEYKFKNTKTRVVHLSTDCVFDGSTGSYKETDIATETNAYGKSKSLGELNNSKDITFRMSIIGPELKNTGTGLMHWFINKSDQVVNGFVDAHWNGLTTLQLAKCIVKYIERPTISGIYHLVSNVNKINKYDLLRMINDVYDLKKSVKKTTGPKIVNKILVDTRCEMDFMIPDYQTQLEELKKYSTTKQ